MSAGTRLDRVRRRYGWLAAVYDFDPTQRIAYRPARARAVELLQLSSGNTVIDIACGTGRNFPLVEERIGSDGRLVAVDLTSAMLRKARSVVERHGWTNVDLIQADAAELSPARIEAEGALPAGDRFDAAICVLGLSVIPHWERAWEAMLSVVRPGGRIAIMDGVYPIRAGDAGETKILRPIVWLICRLAAADCTREPWLLVRRDADQVIEEPFSVGYLRVAAGTTRPGR